jgi:phage terminase large subunit
MRQVGAAKGSRNPRFGALVDNNCGKSGRMLHPVPTGMKLTRVFADNAKAVRTGKRRALNEGGATSSKTFSILQWLILHSIYTDRPCLTSVVSETMPHLKKGALRDFQTIMGDAWNPACWNATDSIYTFGKGVIEFFSADQPGKQRGPRRQILYINEPNNGVSVESCDNLDDRTELFTFMDWNPCGEFFVHERGMLNYPENVYIHSTYLDALDVAPQSYVNNLLAKRERDPNGWNVYGLGLMGKVEGLVYPFFSQVDALPAGNVFYGLDFGFSDDPAVLICNVIQGDNLYSEQLIYQRGLTNQDLAQRMKEIGLRTSYDEIWADSAEPKSIEEIHRYGWNIKPCEKGQGSVEYGHQKVRQYKHYWTKNSTDCIKEQRNFRYIQDKDGKLTEKTTHLFSHGMDARRYGVMGKFEVGRAFMVARAG